MGDLFVADIDAERVGLALDQALVDHRFETGAQDLVALRDPGGARRGASQLGCEPLLEVRQRDRLPVHHRRNPVLDLGLYGRREQADH